MAGATGVAMQHVAISSRFLGVVLDFSSLGRDFESPSLFWDLGVFIVARRSAVVSPPTHHPAHFRP
jgi:hypothetical protein